MDVLKYVIIRNEVIVWPPRSPSSTMYVRLFGFYLKSKMYQDNPTRTSWSTERTDPTGAVSNPTGKAADCDEKLQDSPERMSTSGWTLFLKLKFLQCFFMYFKVVKIKFRKMYGIFFYSYFCLHCSTLSTPFIWVKWSSHKVLNKDRKRHCDRHYKSLWLEFWLVFYSDIMRIWKGLQPVISKFNISTDFRANFDFLEPLNSIFIYILHK